MDTLDSIQGVNINGTMAGIHYIHDSWFLYYEGEQIELIKTRRFFKDIESVYFGKIGRNSYCWFTETNGSFNPFIITDKGIFNTTETQIELAHK